MIRLFASALLVAALVGCQATNSKHERKMGPPPPGYVKILGEPVPNWTPSDVFGLRGAEKPHLNWSFLGPRPMSEEWWSGVDDASGRVVSIAVHPVDPDVAYAASASGGIWKTVNGGAQWTPMSDELSTLNHGYVAIDPAAPDTIYVGTGEYTLGSSGDGLFRSTDGGQIWQQLAIPAEVGSTCSGIIIDPTDPLRIHVTGNAGYVRSDNGGSGWATHLTGSASSLAMHPSDPLTLFAGRHNNGVFRSLNGGDSWTKLAGGLPQSGNSRIIVTIAPSNPDRVYAIIMNNSSTLNGLYRSSDGGDTWARVGSSSYPNGQGWYDLSIAVNPTNPDRVFMGDFNLFASSNGGTSRSTVTTAPLGGTVHVDQHALTYGPDGTLWVGCDGGVWKSTDDAQTWIDLNATLAVTQFYNIGLHPSDSSQVLGGTQDNGTAGRELNVEDWPQVISGDGGFCAYDHQDPSIKYTTYVYLRTFRFDNGGFSEITGPWGGVDSANFIAPLVMDPSDSHTLLGGTTRVWRTNNAHAAANWTAISTNTVSGGGVLNAIAVAETDSDTIYTGSSSGSVYVTTDASTWNNRTAGLPSGQVSDIMIDPQDAATAFVSFHRTSGQRILRTDNFGVNWTNVTGTLPSGVAARALAVDWRFDPPDLYVGSGAGVYSTRDSGATWVKDGLDLPNVNIGDLAIDFNQETITVGTYGRGAWRSALPSTIRPGDLDEDGDVDLVDFLTFVGCYAGAGDPPSACLPADFSASDVDGDNDVDLNDFLVFASQFGAGQ